MHQVVRKLLGIAGMAMAATGCGNEPPAGPPATVTVVEPGPAAPLAPAQWTMPNLVGRDLQDAQNEIQALTNGAIFYTSSHDATGRDRNQVVDSNWKVCAQSVAPGATIIATSRIDFAAVKLDETCP
ncbi:PASTA domain-containing protein [Actinophytocola sp.]|uniref:PASTA domain-containing protein n=1 Tax=Actinophytocola sp. TaxID=1872138 RepID=UPI002D7E33BC|nr:PASTA domain-containing protein [Actinophytocola sp.]HET9138908.1 PASTA domain-containing protein [Actinophytocola sp.]